MRTLSTPRTHQDQDRDRGAVLVLFALIIVALLGIGALVIDIGSLYAERRQLQNGADAGALAVAQDCAGGDCADARGTADQYADLNAKDDVSAVELLCGVGPGLAPCADDPPAGASNASGWVRVRTRTETPEGGDQVSFVLAPIMNAMTGATVRATAVAAWGPPATATVSPFVFSLCEWEDFGGTLGEEPTFPDRIGYIYFHGNNLGNPDAGECISSASGQRLPGGFGRVGGGDCNPTDLTAGNWVSGYTGNSLHRNCPYTAWQNDEIVITVYDDARDVGANAEYRIAGFVGLEVLGYRLGGNRTFATASCPLVGTASSSYICGRFTQVSITGGDFGTGADLGARIIRMVG